MFDHFSSPVLDQVGRKGFTILCLLMGTVLFLLSAFPAQAQKRNFNWVVGSGVWFQFTEDTLMVVEAADTVSLRNASMSDTAGQFVLLADDSGIRNALLEPVAGGSSADLGWNVPAGNYLILPVPGYAMRYAVFINELPPSARAGYVVVDMAADGGSGAVLGPTTWFMEHTTTKIAATTDAAGSGYWILQHGDSDDGFRAFHLHASGLDTVPVLSHAGATYQAVTAPYDNTDRMGMMTFNFEGNMLAAIVNDSGDTTRIELFDFDRSTGQVEQYATVYTVFATRPPFNSACCQNRVDFDPAGRYLYVSEVKGTGNFAFPVQYDLEAEPDSLSHTWERLTGGYLMAPWGYDDRFGAQVAMAPLGYNPALVGNNGVFPHGILLRRMAGVPNPEEGVLYYQMVQHIVPPAFDMDWVSHIRYLPELPLIGGLPNPCKQYLADGTLDVPEGSHAATSGLQVWPNPVRDRAALMYTGRTSPETLVWRDALGREVQRAAVGRVGPTYILDRGNLPAGPYLVEVRDRTKSLGVIKVLCQ